MALWCLLVLLKDVGWNARKIQAVPNVCSTYSSDHLHAASTSWCFSSAMDCTGWGTGPANECWQNLLSSEHRRKEMAAVSTLSYTLPWARTEMEREQWDSCMSKMGVAWWRTGDCFLWCLLCSSPHPASSALIDRLAGQSHLYFCSLSLFSVLQHWLPHKALRTSVRRKRNSRFGSQML